MVQTIPATDITLGYLKEKFGLKLAEDDQFFREWLDDLPQITATEQEFLDEVKKDCLHLMEHRPMLEDLAKMVVLSPLLKLAGFYRAPFDIETEAQVKISVEDEGEVVQGRIDVLVLQGQFWILVIESKKQQFSLDTAIPQSLAYMLANPHPEKPTFGFITNGSSFIFIKLTKQNIPQYAFSDVFSILNRGNDLYSVLRVLKRVGKLLVR
jgi:hypothetical protein